MTSLVRRPQWIFIIATLHCSSYVPFTLSSDGQGSYCGVTQNFTSEGPELSAVPASKELLLFPWVMTEKRSPRRFIWILLMFLSDPTIWQGVYQKPLITRSVRLANTMAFNFPDGHSKELKMAGFPLLFPLGRISPLSIKAPMQALQSTGNNIKCNHEKWHFHFLSWSLNPCFLQGSAPYIKHMQIYVSHLRGHSNHLRCWLQVATITDSCFSHSTVF